MSITLEAIIDEQGNVRLLEPIKVSTRRRALVTILDEEPAPSSEEGGPVIRSSS